MLLFLTKPWAILRQAIVGRCEPAQLAWGAAFGVLLGIVPHGNLLAFALLILLLSLRVNHGIASLAAVAATFLATRLDPYSHRVGQYVLTHEDFSRHLANAWQLPLVPWTDINNTIVTGSLLIGLTALVPIFLIAYPIFHWFAPQGAPVDGGGGAGAMAAQHGTTARDSLAEDSPAKKRRFQGFVGDAKIADQTAPALQPKAIDAAMSGMMGAKPDSHAEPSEPHVIETRIDVIRLSSRQDAVTTSEVEVTDVAGQDEPMSEALNYLLRQLNDSRERRAA